MSNDKGKELEIFVAEKLQEIFQENPAIRPTKASSGGSHNTEVGDILSKKFYVECKNNQNNWFRKRIWQKLLNSLSFGSLKIPLYIIEDEIEGKLIMLTFADFCRILKEKE
jgi:hypothetical protein